ncbi:MAG: LysR family transcriptional regulator [Firmicutes bacterium]|nr:LysR family transcriptional regulator [Bacillota bacterium]
MTDHEDLKLKPRCKLWIENEQKVVFGDGRMALLQAIDRYGSINQAAAKLQMSYRAAWGKLKATEKRLGFKIIHKHIGGRASGSELTPEAKKLMHSYLQFKEESIKAVNGIFEKYFHEFADGKTGNE